MTPTHRQRRWLAAVFAVLLALWTWKLLEPSPVPESVLGGLRSWNDLLPFLLAKTLHLSGYAFLTALGLAWVPRQWKVGLVALMMFHGAVTETLQYLLPFNRVGRVADVLIDWGGIAVGLMVYLVVARACRVRAPLPSSTTRG